MSNDETSLPQNPDEPGEEAKSSRSSHPNRRDVVKATAVMAGGVAAVTYVKPALRGLGIPSAHAMSGGADPTATPTPPPSLPTDTPTATATSTAVPTSTPTATATPTTGNLCDGIFSPGFWKNYDNHFTDAEFYALLKATVDFGATFAALSQADAISLAETILNLTGGHHVRSLLAAELNVAAMPALGLGNYHGIGVVNTLLTTAYTDNGTGNSSPFANGPAWTAQDDEVTAYLGGGGEGQSQSSCRVR